MRRPPPPCPVWAWCTWSPVALGGGPWSPAGCTRRTPGCTPGCSRCVAGVRAGCGCVSVVFLFVGKGGGGCCASWSFICVPLCPACPLLFFPVFVQIPSKAATGGLVTSLFEWLVPPTLYLVQSACKQLCPVTDIELVGSITALLDCFLAPIVAGTADVKVCASPVCGECMACRMRSGEAAATAGAAFLAV